MTDPPRHTPCLSRRCPPDHDQSLGGPVTSRTQAREVAHARLLDEPVSYAACSAAEQTAASQGPRSPTRSRRSADHRGAATPLRAPPALVSREPRWARSRGRAMAGMPSGPRWPGVAEQWHDHGIEDPVGVFLVHRLTGQQPALDDQRARRLGHRRGGQPGDHLTARLGPGPHLRISGPPHPQRSVR